MFQLLSLLNFGEDLESVTKMDNSESSERDIVEKGTYLHKFLPSVDRYNDGNSVPNLKVSDL